MLRMMSTMTLSLEKKDNSAHVFVCVVASSHIHTSVWASYPRIVVCVVEQPIQTATSKPGYWDKCETGRSRGILLGNAFYFKTALYYQVITRFNN